jgi:monoamine oxidase
MRDCPAVQLRGEERVKLARTPLLRAFERLAEDHHTAMELGIPPAELRGQRTESEYSRGEFIKRAGVAGAGFAVIPGSRRMLRKPAATAPRIAIVGGGIAGLNAALTLADKGYASTIYEASTDRIGGRMHSDNSGFWSSGQVSEWCGELIDSDHVAIRHLAQRFGLNTVDLLAAQLNGSTNTNWIFDNYYTEGDADNDFQAIHSVLQKQISATSYPTTYLTHTDAGVFFDQMTVYDWIENYVPGGHKSRFGAFLDAAYNEEYGSETRGQSALNLMYLLGFQAKPGNFSIFGKSDERFHIAGGNQQLPEAIANHLGRQTIKQGWAMQSVRTNADGTISLGFATPGKNQTVTADHVILCMSFSVLRTLDYSHAGFDQRKQTAITQLGSGVNAKLQLQFDNRYWQTQGPWGVSNANIYADNGIQNAWDVTRAQSGAQGILVQYSGGNVSAGYKPSTPYSNNGSGTANDATVNAYANAFLAELEQIYPGITPHWNGKATLSTPFRDPLLNCSYSYWKPGQYVGFSGYEGAQQGNIHFAGEHCSVNFQGYMEGGAEEGARAATEILNQV